MRELKMVSVSVCVRMCVLTVGASNYKKLL